MEFVDTTPTQKGGVFIPSEALMINGNTIEEQISGYQTLTVTGRGPLPKKITAETPDGRDGQQFIEAYYTTRSIVVAYQIIADTAEDLIAKYSQLATILGNNEFTFNFKDDPDWYYTGTVTATSDLPVGVLAGNGSFTITCSDPHSYSTTKSVSITARYEMTALMLSSSNLITRQAKQRQQSLLRMVVIRCHFRAQRLTQGTR